MNQSIYETNLAALQQHFPEVAQALENVSFEGLGVEAIQTQNGLVSARVQPEAAAKPVLLHSRYDPLREAQRWAGSIEIKQPTNVVVMGMGLGYHLNALIKTHNPNIRHCIVVEPDARIVRLAFTTVDCRTLLSRNGINMIVGASPEDVPELIGEAKTDFILHNFRILEHETSLQCHPQYYQQATRCLLERMTKEEVNLRTSFENKGRNQFNILVNLPAMLRGLTLTSCRNLLDGYPAIVAAAGPSLNKNIEHLRHIDDRAALLIVDTAQASFRKMTIAPDVVVTGDPTPLNFSHFETIDTLGESILAFHPEVNRKITQKFVKHPYLLPMFDEQSWILKRLFDLSAFGTMERAMNVGHLAFNLARHFGCRPIILAGFDYAFPKSGGTTHAKEAALSRSVSRFGPEGQVEIGEKAGKAAAEKGTMTLVPGYYGDEVPTTVPFTLYIRSIEEAVAACDFEVIDATEGGAFFQGTTLMPLAEAMQKHLQHTGVQERLATFKQTPPNPNPELLLNGLREGQTVLKTSQKTTQALMTRLKHWQPLIHQSPSWETVNQEWKTFDQLWCEMVGDPLFNDVLGTSVQYLYFLRQRSTQPKDDSPAAFLSVLNEKYDFILRELHGLLENFVHSIDLAIASIEIEFNLAKRG